MDTGFQKLLEPSYIGKVKTRNRIIKTAQGSSFIEPTGYVGEQAKAYYETMAKGGVGLLIVESCGVEYPLGIHHFPVQFHLDDDKYIPSYTELVQVIHKTRLSGIFCNFSTPVPGIRPAYFPNVTLNLHQP